MISGRRARSSGTDQLLSRLYQQLTEQQAAGFRGGYDMAAGLDRYRAWLGQHATAGHAVRAASQPPPTTTTPRSDSDEHPAAATGWDADQAVTELYGAHYRSLVRLATLLVHDIVTAEEIVQDCFTALHATGHRVAAPTAR